MQQGILLVDDDPGVLAVCRSALTSIGYADVTTLDDSRKVLPFLERNRCSVIFLDLMMPHLAGTDLLPQLAAVCPGVPVVVMTASDDVKTAVTCMKLGAFDFLLKPVNVDLLAAAIEKTRRVDSLNRENSTLREYLLHDQLKNPQAFQHMVTGSKKMRAIFQYIEVISESDQPVLVEGETGVGKELIARAISHFSGRGGKFVTVNVAGLDDTMFSDTLFGHRKGAFTGADQAREGLVATAGGGTLFLDEIGDLPEISQVKLLRLIQEQEYYPVGSDAVRSSDARLVVATNRNLEQAMAEGKFRKDLYYRLCAHRITIPPLRERREDIPLLLAHFIGKAAAQLRKSPPEPAPELVAVLSSCRFEGNVRELHALVFDAVARHSSGRLTLEHFPRLYREMPALSVPEEDVPAAGGALCSVFGRFPTLREVEEYMIASAMKATNNNQRAAASMLGIARQTLSKKLLSGSSSGE